MTDIKQAPDPWSIVTILPEDFEPWGTVDRDGDDYHGDCSCGCVWFRAYDGDWGKCLNPASHRYKLLTFEHQGCLKFEYDEDEDVFFGGEAADD